MTTIIRAANLSKSFQIPVRQKGLAGSIRHLFRPAYRMVQAVDQVSFSLEPGELIGYLGPNGAGKSTTMKMLTGLLVPTSGDVIVDGFIPWRDRTKYVANIGAVFGQRNSLWWDLPVIDSLELRQPMYQIPMQTFHRNLRQFRDLLELDEFLDKPVRSLSLGQRMRAELCCALLDEPKLLFLDEPTIGLDVVAKERIRQFIRHANRERGTTIILTTHDLTDVERLCERVLMIDQGKLLYDGQLANLIDRFETSRLLVLTFDREVEPVVLPGMPAPVMQGRQVIYTFDSTRFSAADLINKIQSSASIIDLEIRRPDLESTIRRIYEQGLLTSWTDGRSQPDLRKAETPMDC